MSGLRARLLLIVTLVLAPVWVVTVYRFNQERRLLGAAVDRDAQHLARATASLEDGLIDGVHQAMVSLAQADELRRVPARCIGMIESVAQTFSFYAELAVFTSGGDLLCAGRSAGNALARVDRDLLREAIAARAFVTGLYHGPVAGDAGTLGFAYPIVLPDGRASGTVFAAVHMAAFSSPFDEVQIPESGSLVILDRGGTVLARHPQPHGWAGRTPNAPLVKTIVQRGEGLIETADLDGFARVYAFLPLRAAGNRVFVAAGLSRQEALGDLERRNELQLMGLAFISLLGLAAAWVMGGRTIGSQLQPIIGVARRLQAGDLAARVAVPTAGDVKLLAEAFNDMAARVGETVNTEREARAVLSQQINTVVADRTREVSLLNQMGELLQACFSLDQAYGVLGGVVHQFFPGRAGSVLVFNESRDLVEEVAAWGQPSGHTPSFAPDECWALRGGRPHVVDEEGGTPFCQHVMEPLPTGSICIPLLAQGEAFGIFYLCNPAGAHVQGFPEETRRLAAAVAKQIALALANLRLRETLRGQSIRDSLTGLYNRRYMEETVERELRRAGRSGRPLGVIMLDIDSFKLLNDTFGHAGGDAVLRAVGNLLKTIVRGSDIACRYGGDEIVLILPETGLEPTSAKAEQLREAVKRLQVTHRGQTIERISVSLGVAAFPDHGHDASTVLAAADEAQYVAKAAGKDQVRIAVQQPRFDSV